MLLYQMDKWKKPGNLPKSNAPSGTLFLYLESTTENIYLSNNNSEHFDVWSRSMANTYQTNKQNFIYRNGCAKEISKKIKDRRNKK
jgi:hypothetical protein